MAALGYENRRQKSRAAMQKSRQTCTIHPLDLRDETIGDPKPAQRENQLP
jgi:hypothetical protein